MKASLDVFNEGGRMMFSAALTRADLANLRECITRTMTMAVPSYAEELALLRLVVQHALNEMGGTPALTEEQQRLANRSLVWRNGEPQALPKCDGNHGEPQCSDPGCWRGQGRQGMFNPNVSGR